MKNEVDLCRGCNTMKHLSDTGYCGRCGGQATKQGLEMVLLAWISNPAVVETVMEKVEAYKDEAVREVLEDNKRLFSMLQNHRAATNNDKEWKDLIDRNQDVFNRLKDK